MDNSKSREEKIKKKQKLLFGAGCVLVLVAVAAFIFRIEEPKAEPRKMPTKEIATASKDIDEENIRIAWLESRQNDLDKKLSQMLAAQTELQETLKNTSQMSLMRQQEETEYLEGKMYSLVGNLQEDMIRRMEVCTDPEDTVQLASVTKEDEGDDMQHVTAYIPAGTIVRCVLVSSADCSVGIHQPKGPSKMLLRPLSNGKLPRNVRVALKDSVITASAIGDLANERVYVRTDRMTLVQPNGDFLETEISAYVSGEDGREGLRGVVVDRSGSIIARASFASFLQGIEASLRTTLNSQSIEKVAKNSESNWILNGEDLRNSGMQGVNTSLNKLSEYYIKRAEQLQPTIEIGAGRIVDLIFTHGVKIGEQDIKKKFAIERSLSKERKNAP